MTDLERAAKLCEEVGMPNGVKVTSEGKWALCQTAPTPEDINGIVLHPIHATAILCDHFCDFLKAKYDLIDIYDSDRVILLLGNDTVCGHRTYRNKTKLAALCAAVESEVK